MSSSSEIRKRIAASPAFVAGLVLCILLLSGSACGDDEELRNNMAGVSVEGFLPLEEERVIWSLRYLRASVHTQLFESLLQQAVDGDVPLFTQQEFLRVGPYVPCNRANEPTLGRFREPEFVYNDPSSAAGEVVRILRRVTNDLTVERGAFTSPTARTRTEPGFDHDEEVAVELGERAFTQQPDHQIGWTDARFGEIDPAYPVDELAGIIAHEILHTHGFEHGDDDNQCGYDSYDCDSPAQREICRKNSLPEIIEAVVSEIVEFSVAWCPRDGVTSVEDADDLWQPINNPRTMRIADRIYQGSPPDRLAPCSDVAFL